MYEVKLYGKSSVSSVICGFYLQHYYSRALNIIVIEIIEFLSQIEIVNCDSYYLKSGINQSLGGKFRKL